MDQIPPAAGDGLLDRRFWLMVGTPRLQEWSDLDASTGDNCIVVASGRL